MAKIHDLFIIELAEVIKGYGNNPDVEDPFRLSEFYRFYELPNIAVSRENFEKMRPVEPERKTGRWIYGEDEYGIDGYHCDKCGFFVPWDYTHKFINYIDDYHYCPNCGHPMGGDGDE